MKLDATHLFEKGAKCGCGRIGCFEALASRTAVVKSDHG
ncbi:MAG: ROK family protein [Ignavibacteriales bacterium]|nr:ROK family protein [Ignavibacteriales bacterium]